MILLKRVRSFPCDPLTLGKSSGPAGVFPVGPLRCLTAVV